MLTNLRKFLTKRSFKFLFSLHATNRDSARKYMYVRFGLKETDIKQICNYQTLKKDQFDPIKVRRRFRHGSSLMGNVTDMILSDENELGASYGPHYRN